jgi:hypothetical protein
MMNKKCLLDTIASYSFDVTLAVGHAAACAAIALILSLSEPPLDASAVPWMAPEQFDGTLARDRKEVSVTSASS